MATTDTVARVDIDLDGPDEQRSPAGPSWLILAVAVIIAVGLTTLVTNYTADQRTTPPAGPVSHMITFEWSGDGQATFAAVWTEADGRIFPVASQSSERYQDPRAAILTVTSKVDGHVRCQITVDGQLADLVDAGPASGPSAATCVWLPSA